MAGSAAGCPDSRSAMPPINIKRGQKTTKPPKPPIDEPAQAPPGLEANMRIKPDHGEFSYKGCDRLQGKVALITGGDSGIGRAVAIALAREGADIAISYLPEEQTDARETAKWVRHAGRECLELAGDICNEAHCRGIVKRTEAELGRLDILVNNAAFQRRHPSIEEFTAEEWERTFQTNIHAMFYLCRAAMPRMEPGSAIINTASVHAYQPDGELLAYSATKGAIITFTKALSELAIGKGIRVNAVAPGPVWTPLIPSTSTPEKLRSFGEKSALERPAQPAELAPAYVFLATYESTYVTGSVMDLTGGRMLP
jgi:NAD(P)-dependent dehydrogenase (short-subunit alcohol dehydrogenase family)